MKTPFNKFLYIGFLLLGLFQALFSKDYIQAASMVLPTHVTSEVNLIIKINHHHNLVVVGNGK
jgi:hypothetical protein